jgi:NADH-quinone oxidoreductase subunit L
MVMALGTGAYMAGFFHLVTHAMFKACLFLGSGSVIHAMHHALHKIHSHADAQDMRNMGGLKKHMPTTFWTFLIATMSLAGVPFFSGFLSKDAILGGTLAFAMEHPVHWILPVFGFAAAGLTAFYMFRLLILTFFGAYRGAGPGLVPRPVVPAPVFADAGGHGHGHEPDAVAGHARDAHGAAHASPDPHDAGHAGHAGAPPALPHESPAAMTIPLVVLAALAVVAGFLGLPQAFAANANAFEHWLAPVFAPLREPELAEGGVFSRHVWEWVLMAASVGVAVLGAFVAYVFYVLRPDLPGRVAAAAASAHRVLLDKYYVDEFYQAAVVRPLLAFERLCARFDLHVIDGLVDGVARFGRGASDYSGWVDATCVDGLVNGTAETVAEAGRQARRVQTGRLRGYLAYSVAGLLVLVLAYNVWAARDLLGTWARHLLPL